MRDPHIIIGAFIERYLRETGLKLKLVAITKAGGGFRAAVEGKAYYASATGLTMDAALQALATTVQGVKS